MGVDALWMTAAEYLATCPRQGRSQLSSFITRIPLGEDAAADRFSAICSLCEQHQFTAELLTVRRVMAEQCRRQGYLGQAIAHSLVAGDVDRANSLVCEALQKFSVEQSALEKLSLVSASAVETINKEGGSAAISTNLQFLQDYCRFHALLKVHKPVC